MSARPIPTPGAAPHTTSTRAAVDDWRTRAACLGAPEDLWFSADWEREPERTWRVDAAKATCDACHVKDACLQWALNENIDHGVWGGLAEDERRSLKRRNARAARRADQGDPAPAPAPPTDTSKTNPTDRPICGTHGGYEAHTRKRERQCDACRDWKAGARLAATPPPCGTLPGYRHHTALQEPTCAPCRAAKAASSAEYRRQQRRTAA